MLQPKIVSVRPLSDCRLLLTYDGEASRVFDVTPYASGAWYEELLDAAYFKTVRLLDGGRGVEWPHGQDIAPHELYELSVPVA